MRYPGQVADEHSALHDNWQRQYQPLLGRYTQADPIGLAGGWNRFNYVAGNPILWTDPRGLDHPGMGPYGPPWTGVWRCERPINISWVGHGSAVLPNHNWLLTGAHEAGMGAECPVPGQGCSDTPGARTQTIDHRGQSLQPGAQCTLVPDADEQCVSAAIRPGLSTGRWMPWNQCQSFADDVLDRCLTKPKIPFAPGQGQMWR
ncbi:MAG: RHS repeat-associated core domain-containing protein [Chloroflexota bacterium]